jgi:Cu+-exporting ATPase
MVVASDGATESQIRKWMRGMAESSSHVLAVSLARHLEREGVERGSTTDIQSVPGRGVTGMARDLPLRLGSPAMMGEIGAEFGAELQRQVASAMASALGVVCFAVGDGVVAVASFSESLRPESREALARLGGLGLGTSILTGDHRKRAERIGTELGVEVISELSPPGKVDAVARLRARCGRVAMVGDGLNDAPALLAADVGMAMGCGADLTRESGDVCLLGNDLRGVPFAIALARKTVRTIQTNLFWAFAYNAIGIGLALSGLLNPMIAAGAMVLSSIFVVTNSLRPGRDEIDLASTTTTGRARVIPESASS